MKDVIGVTFKNTAKVYYFECNEDEEYELNNNVIVETSRGVEFAKIAIERKSIDENTLSTELKKVLRLANSEDKKTEKENIQAAKEAYTICEEKIKNHNLKMNLVQNEYTFDKSKLIFYFTAENRVDFRELVKELASIFKTRIELRQIGVRDEAKRLGGYGICGREYCCKGWLGDFNSVSIKMAKDQDLSLNPTKILGSCGRLFCCLKFENETYEEIIKELPVYGNKVKVDGNIGEVVGRNVLLKKVKVLVDENNEKVVKEYDLADIELLKNQGIDKEDTVELDLKKSK